MTDDEFDVEIDLEGPKPLSPEQLAALGGSEPPTAHTPTEIISSPYTVIPPPTPPPPPPKDADPDEEPPEPEGHPLTKAVSEWMPKGQEFFHGPLPSDIAAIWAHPPMRVGDEATARILIGAWGLDTFRGSALHQAALADRARLANSSEVTARFKSEREKAKKGR